MQIASDRNICLNRLSMNYDTAGSAAEARHALPLYPGFVEKIEGSKGVFDDQVFSFRKIFAWNEDLTLPAIHSFNCRLILVIRLQGYGLF